MKANTFFLFTLASVTLIFQVSCRDEQVRSVTVPFILDHNRMLVEAEFQRKDGTWRKATLWIDTGNPDFLISEEFAKDMGIEIDTSKSDQAIPSPAGVRIGGMPVNFDGVATTVAVGVKWLFNTMHIDANIPSKVLKKYHIIFDYPLREFTIAEPGILKPRGVKSPSAINPVNGIIQMDATIDGEKYSFALDNGASFSFATDSLVAKLKQRHPDWPTRIGAVGCANIWGWWPYEENWPIIRIPEINWGALTINDALLVGLPPFFYGGTDIATWYSQKTAHPVNGFFGPNMFRAFRIEIVYPDNALYFEKSPDSSANEMNIVGLTLRPLDDGKYSVIGVTEKEGKPGIEGILKGDILLQIGELKTTGTTMGKVIDALRGNPGDIRILTLERDGKQFKIEARVEHIL